MFDTGFKQVVINDESVIKAETIDGVDYINIEGFGKFEVGVSTLNESRAHEQNLYGSTTITGAPAGWAADQIWIVDLFIVYGLGQGSHGAVDEAGETVSFQVGMPRVAPGGTAPTTFEEMLKISVDEFKRDLTGDDEFSMITFDGVDTFSFENGYEGFTIQNVIATKTYDPQVPNFDDRLSVGIDITGTVTEGYFGFGYPQQVEAAIRNATPWTAPQYSIQFGGNDSVIHWSGHRYSEVSWITAGDHYVGKEPAEVLGYGDANTATLYKERKYSVYILDQNEAGPVNAAGIALLKTI